MIWMKRAWAIAKGTIREFQEDKVLRLSAAMAYYAIFSIGPLLVLIIGIAGSALAALEQKGAEKRVREEVSHQIQGLMGEKSAKMVEGMMTQRPGAPGAPGRPGISAQDVARNVGNNQISAALGALASHPNQPEIPGRNPAYTFQDALGRSQVAGSLQDAQQGVADANVGQAFQLFGPRKGIGNQKPQRVTSQTTTKAQQQSDAARRAYENAYGANFAQTNRVLNPGRAALINAGDAGRQAVAQGRSPFVDAMIQRLLGQRAVGVRGL
jgi:hypothetical protein